MKGSLLLVALLIPACGQKDATKAELHDNGAIAPAGTIAPREKSGPAASNAPAGEVPPDGKYERVTVEGVTVPMIHVMNHGTVVLVDTDGAKPRTWEEQYKQKRSTAVGTFDVHKTNVNKNDTFEDDPIDREGLWAIDGKGNITKR
jgi:hypothetical protein